ncbi:hypothetical protein M3P36_04910 [Altererythrobacter sp. KTW20L]|uniref:hypothetical protein n=1 Tax=Altererythrobacter sp. KTW20L TaxID=2942210 RepID=UPI0020BFF1E6|nr:hypothetical protein [Altererythrobacter sp. KTW20L]MCL6250389.1 hypothetical protein [Altererythrobacter sp. KTW20L]
MHTSQYHAEVIVLEGGERLPLLIDRATGVPDGFATDYSLAAHRGKPINTTHRAIAAIAIFYDWARSREINLEKRFGTLRLFTSDELTSLADFLWLDRRPVRNGAMPRSVVGQTQGSRVDSLIAYLKWRVGLVVSSLSNDDVRVVQGNLRLEATTDQLRNLKGKSVSTERGQIDEGQCKRLFEIVRPGSEENPFQKRTQLRNFVILLAYYELGIRRAEILTLKGGHASIGPRSTFHITFTPNDPEDPRKDMPSVKTRSRLLPVSKRLAAAYEGLLKERRSNPATARAAKKTAFVVLSTTDGAPLSIDAVDDIFVVLRSRFPEIFPPDFAPHHLRRTWNYRFSKACENAGAEEKLVERLHRYLMGWSIKSSQPGKYNQRYIEEQAFAILISMQDAMTGESS